jgi:hypothetical protein
MKNIRRFGNFVVEARLPMEDVTKLNSIYAKVNKMVEDLESVEYAMKPRPGKDARLISSTQRVNAVEPEGMRKAQAILMDVSKVAAGCSTLIEKLLSGVRSEDEASSRTRYQAPDEIMSKLKEESLVAAKGAGFKKGDSIKFRQYSGFSTGKVIKIIFTEDDMHDHELTFPSLIVSGHEKPVPVFSIAELNGSKTPWFDKLSAIAKRLSKSMLKST